MCEMLFAGYLVPQWSPS